MKDDILNAYAFQNVEEMKWKNCNHILKHFPYNLRVVFMYSSCQPLLYQVLSFPSTSFQVSFSFTSQQQISNSCPTLKPTQDLSQMFLSCSVLKSKKLSREAT